MRPFLLSQLLSARAAESPGEAATSANGATTSYALLDELSNRLAATLHAAGVGYGDRVGIYLPKGLSAYVAIFATLKLGAAYVPLDPAAPAARILLTVRDCGVRALITTEGLARDLADAPAIPSLATAVLEGSTSQDRSAHGFLPRGASCLTWDEALAHSAAPPANPASEDDLAYVLYTSGSTGHPKGVMISHRAAMAFVEWSVETVGLSEDDRVAAVAALHFDLSVFDLFATVAAGATLLPLPPGMLLRPRQLTDWIADEKITAWYSTPSLLVLMLQQGDMERRSYPHLRRVLFAGEVFPTKHLRHLRRILPRATLFNLYGPTETNVCTWKRIDEVPADDRQTISIGQACAGTRVLALDADGRETEVGAEGELWVYGPTVMQGYWGDSEKSATVLRQRPGVTPGGELWYRTGDLVHRDAGGDLHFHGRRDHMVKIQGYRVEIGEVESALYTHPNVRELAVVTVTADQVRRLRACIVPHDRAEHSIVQLKAFLGRRLPAYMIPAEVKCLDSLPRTSTGKVDRQALAAAA